jgi:hypothetical protein
MVGPTAGALLARFPGVLPRHERRPADRAPMPWRGLAAITGRPGSQNAPAGFLLAKRGT